MQGVQNLFGVLGAGQWPGWTLVFPGQFGRLALGVKAADCLGPNKVFC